MIKEGLLDNPLFQLCLGIPWGAPADTTTMKAMVDNLPADAVRAGFGIGRMQMPMAAQAVLLGGNVRGPGRQPVAGQGRTRHQRPTGGTRQ